MSETLADMSHRLDFDPSMDLFRSARHHGGDDARAAFPCEASVCARRERRSRDRSVRVPRARRHASRAVAIVDGGGFGSDRRTLARRLRAPIRARARGLAPSLAHGASPRRREDAPLDLEREPRRDRVRDRLRVRVRVRQSLQAPPWCRAGGVSPSSSRGAIVRDVPRGCLRFLSPERRSKPPFARRRGRGISFASSPDSSNGKEHHDAGRKSSQACAPRQGRRKVAEHASGRVRPRRDRARSPGQTRGTIVETSDRHRLVEGASRGGRSASSGTRKGIGGGSKERETCDRARSWSSAEATVFSEAKACRAKRPETGRAGGRVEQVSLHAGTRSGRATNAFGAIDGGEESVTHQRSHRPQDGREEGRTNQGAGRSQGRREEGRSHPRVACVLFVRCRFVRCRRMRRFRDRTFVP